eukprot:CAMPEP_0174347442 /NCGR_PEP_ID=MMETSP0811_2-20130205/3529_1 /TAXON_ID=73025 ORGANISM="Eutreptiella gymnastica-like, Strain CCMP1594" /NCGR_SAMPLE_ID=MMETSP0811_2 /ASSEMBLY_ACC=CAM_ASM_000667 /LENGTH=144 /DNA_ID=CAMNT_0015473015 /DNA_START=206 /DNA_END=638 /DNA_ORIENTATION=+
MAVQQRESPLVLVSPCHLILTALPTAAPSNSRNCWSPVSGGDGGSFEGMTGAVLIKSTSHSIASVKGPALAVVAPADGELPAVGGRPAVGAPTVPDPGPGVGAVFLPSRTPMDWQPSMASTRDVGCTCRGVGATGAGRCTCEQW